MWGKGQRAGRQTLTRAVEVQRRQTLTRAVEVQRKQTLTRAVQVQRRQTLTRAVQAQRKQTLTRAVQVQRRQTLTRAVQVQGRQTLTRAVEVQRRFVGHGLCWLERQVDCEEQETFPTVPNLDRLLRYAVDRDEGDGQRTARSKGGLCRTVHGCPLDSHTGQDSTICGTRCQRK
jgi:hypothetical protein